MQSTHKVNNTPDLEYPWKKANIFTLTTNNMPMGIEGAELSQNSEFIHNKG